jgi:hypothetical protein
MEISYSTAKAFSKFILKVKELRQLENKQLIAHSSERVHAINDKRKEIDAMIVLLDITAIRILHNLIIAEPVVVA